MSTINPCNEISLNDDVELTMCKWTGISTRDVSVSSDIITESIETNDNIINLTANTTEPAYIYSWDSWYGPAQTFIYQYAYPISEEITKVKSGWKIKIVYEDNKDSTPQSPPPIIL